MNIDNLLNKDDFTKDEMIFLLNVEGDDLKKLYAKSAEVKEINVGKISYLRGLIEFSNICAKNCLYCGIRKDNKLQNRYNLTDDEIIGAAKFAYQSNYASLVLQSGEIESNSFINRVDNLLKRIMEVTDSNIGITLSCGEQSYDTYQRWFGSGARRYLLRIESSNKDLYYKIHPKNKLHDFEKRIQCLLDLKKIGYQVGTGVMIGLPFQTIENLADDLIFMKEMDIDMCGMGPYIEHKDTPLFEFREQLLPLKERFELTLKMIALLRILMKDINIAASTAMQSIDKLGREKALKIGANVIMPNITPGAYRDFYKLYENKPCTDEQAEDCMNCMEVRISLAGDEIGYKEFGDSLHYKKRIQSN